MMAHLTTDEQREFMLLLRKFVGQTDTRNGQSSVK
jgi:hypothetical protein